MTWISRIGRFWRLRRSFVLPNDTATTAIYTLSLHDALPISIAGGIASALAGGAMSKLFGGGQKAASGGIQDDVPPRSEERFSRNAETDLVCRLLLEKKKPSSGVSYV